MRRISRWAWLLLALLAAPAPAQGPRKPPDKKEAENKLIKAGSLVGEIVHIEPSKNSIRLKVTYQYAELNAGAYQGLLRAQSDLALARDINARNNALRAMAQHQQNLYTMKSSTKEFPIDAAEKCEVRLSLPKAAFDEMGNVKKLKPKELAALRGKDKLFDGEFSDLTTGQVVQVSLVRNKPLPRTKDKDKNDLEENRPQASRIVVLRQPAPQP